MGKGQHIETKSWDTGHGKYDIAYEHRIWDKIHGTKDILYRTMDTIHGT